MQVVSGAGRAALGPQSGSQRQSLGTTARACASTSAWPGPPKKTRQSLADPMRHHPKRLTGMLAGTIRRPGDGHGYGFVTPPGALVDGNPGLGKAEAACQVRLQLVEDQPCGGFVIVDVQLVVNRDARGTLADVVRDAGVRHGVSKALFRAVQRGFHCMDGVPDPDRPDQRIGRTVGRSSRTAHAGTSPAAHSTRKRAAPDSMHAPLTILVPRGRADAAGG